MNHTAFVPTAAMKENLSSMHQRTTNPGPLTVMKEHPAGASLSDSLNEDSTEYFHQGGAGLFTTVGDYCKFLTVYLNRGQPILKSETFEIMTQDYAPSNAVGFAGRYVETAIAFATNDVPAWFMDAPGKQGQGLSFIIQREDVPGMRRKGSVSWAGLCNCYW